MFISSVTDRGATPAIVKMLAFNESRLRMISENVANINTPGYRAKQLDTRAFQRSLRAALDTRARDPKSAFVVRSGDEVRTDGQGYLQVTPSRKPSDNVLFHDGTNLSIEREMADLAETGMTHDLYTTLLNGRFHGLRNAIRGTL
ncbi:MAG: flagellar basal body rod protein FlgB [Phycisphaerae bacterium]|jgi:flagellar basal-body rod protein FlgB